MCGEMVSLMPPKNNTISQTIFDQNLNGSIHKVLRINNKRKIRWKTC